MVNQLELAIFNSYVKLPEGISIKGKETRAPNLSALLKAEQVTKASST